MQGIGFRSRRPLVPVTLALAAGVCLGSLCAWQWWPLWTAAYCLLSAVWMLNAQGPGRTAFLLMMACVAYGGAALAAIRRADVDRGAVHRIGLERSGPVHLVGRVATMPELRGGDRGSPIFEFLLEVEWIARGGMSWEPSSGRIRMVVRGAHAGIVFGGRLLAWGVVRSPASAMNPGEFDARAYWLRKGVALECRVGASAVTALDSRAQAWFERVAARLRTHMRETLAIGIERDPRIRAVIAGMIYGDRAGFGERLVEAFRKTGTMHLFAVSGQNVGVIAMAGIVVLRVLGFNRWRWGWLVVPVLGLYTLATGAQASAVRAFEMAALVLLAWFMDRPVSAGQLLAGAAALMVLAEPAQIFDVGFQLSFSVVLALVVLTPPLYSKMAPVGAPDAFLPRRLWPAWLGAMERARRMAVGTVAASVAAYLGSAPLTAWYFHIFSPVSVLVNVAVVPLASIVVIGGGLSLGGAAVHPVLAIAFNKMNWLMATAIVGLVECAGSLPLSSFNVGMPCHDVRLVSLAVGEGQAVIVRDGGRCEMFDCGSRMQTRGIVGPALRHFGINRIDRLWLSHNDSAHAGGFENVMAAWPVRQLVLSDPVSRRGVLNGVLERHSQKAHRAEAGDRFVSRRLAWEILRPGPGERASIADDNGIVARLRWRGGSVLFMGDAGASVESELLRGGDDLRSDVILLGRHAREENLSAEFLNAVAPKHVVFNAGWRTHEKMTESQRSRISGFDAALWDLSITGAVMIRCHERGVDVTRLMKGRTGP